MQRIEPHMVEAIKLFTLYSNVVLPGYAPSEMLNMRNLAKAFGDSIIAVHEILSDEGALALI